MVEERAHMNVLFPKGQALALHFGLQLFFVFAVCVANIAYWGTVASLDGVVHTLRIRMLSAIFTVG